jgi:hypothetical protein
MEECVFKGKENRITETPYPKILSEKALDKVLL